MSIAINNSHEIDYNVIGMEKPSIAVYMERIYLAWINSLGQVRSQREFAQLLGMDRQRFNNYYNGKRTNMDYPTAQHVAQVAAGFGAVKPYEILDILGYPHPVEAEKLSLDLLPPDARSRLEAALAEIREIYAAGDDPRDPSAIAVSVLEKHGITIRSIK